MKVLIYGETSRVGSGAWCYAQTLLEMGLKVLEFQDSFGLDRYRHSFFLRGIRRFNGLPLSRDIRVHSDALLDQVRKSSPDIVLILKGLYISGELILALKKAGSWVVNLNHDDFFSTNRSSWSKLQRAAIPFYDHIFSTRNVNVSEISPINAKVDFLPFSYYPRIHRSVSISEDERKKYGYDVLFVGTWEKARCDIFERLVRRVPVNYAIYGSQWEKVGRLSILKPFIKGRELGPDEMAKAIGVAKISLGFLRKENRDDYTQRTFEVPACGGVFLAERTKMHLSLLKEGIEAEFFNPSSPDELASKVIALLGDEERRQRMRDAGKEAIDKGRHTYRDRMDFLFRRFEIWSGSAEGKSRIAMRLNP